MILTSQALSVIVMFFCGILVGTILDGFRTFWSNHRHWQLYRIHRIFEIIIWILLGLATFYVIFLVKGGAWRYLDPLAQFLGIFVYSLALKRLFRFLGRIGHTLLIKPVIFIMHLIVSIIGLPIKFTIRLIKVLLRPITKRKGKFCKYLSKYR